MRGRPGVKSVIILLFPFSLHAAVLNERIEQILRHHQLSDASLSFQFVRVSDGGILYERNSDRTLNPASTLKLVTAAAALQLLGPDFTFQTDFYSNRPLRAGVLDRLWIKGHGDPLLVTEEMDKIVTRFQAAGLKRIEGAVYVDDTYFDHDDLMTYLSEDGDKVYQIAIGPLSFNFNTVEIRARPGGRVGDQASYEGVLDPATFTGTVFLEELERRGIDVPQMLHRQAVPPGAIHVLSHASPPLRKILESLGKHSNNFAAEQLFKTLGAVGLGPPGSQQKGRQVVESFLGSLGVPEGRYYVENGSGLSKLSHLSASQLVRVLLHLYRSPVRDDLISSLSRGGVDGTMKKRCRGILRGRVAAKTGTLHRVNAVAGYLFGQNETVAFAMLMNDFSVSHREAVRVQDLILEAMVRFVNSTTRT